MRRFFTMFSAMILALGLGACAGSTVSDNMCEGLTHTGTTAAEMVTQGAVASGETADSLNNMMLRVVDSEAPSAVVAAPTSRAASIKPRRRIVRLNLLALSTGGQYGAFSSGFLSGWTKVGTRPNFNVVTGASAGGIIAPVVFAGPEFDDRLSLNTDVSDRDLVRRRGVLELLGATALYDTKPLETRIRDAVDAELVAAIGARWEAPGFEELGCEETDEVFSACVTRALFAKGEALAMSGNIQWKGPREVRDAAREF